MTRLREIGWPHAGPPTDPAWAGALAAHPGARPARVTEQHRSGYVVAEAPGEGYSPESRPEWQRAKCPPEQRPAVGDWVLVEGEGASARIVALLPRFSAIKRGAAGEHYRQQLVAANIDTAFVVCGLDADFNPRRIERYLLLLSGSGVQPVVVLTKADKDGADADAAMRSLSATLAQGVAVVAVNAKDRASVAALEPWLGEGRSVVLVGSSGAGKSTLANTLLGIEKMKTGDVRSSDDRGRHTTTHRALVALPPASAGAGLSAGSRNSSAISAAGKVTPSSSKSPVSRTSPFAIGTWETIVLPMFACQMRTVQVSSRGTRAGSRKPLAIANGPTAEDRLPQLPLQSMKSPSIGTCPYR